LNKNDMRKEFTLLIILSALLGSTLTGYFLTRPNVNQTDILSRQGAMLGRFTGNLNQGESTTLPIPDGLFQITDDITLSPVTELVGDGLLYYHADNGFVSRVDIGSRQSTLISQTALPGLRNVIWSPNRQRVVTVFSSQHGQVFRYFDYETRVSGDLPLMVVDVVFSPNSQSLAMTKQVGDETDIIITDPDGTNPNTILKTHLPHITLLWPQTHTLAFATKDDAGVASYYLLGDNGDLKKIIDSETGLRYSWSKDGSKFMYSTSESGLNVYDTNSGQYGSQVITATANLCAWYSDNQNIICAVDDQGEIKIQQLRVGDTTPKTIASNLIISPERLFISSDEQFLIILSQSDHSLYAIKLQ
jgi:hypothetical protein